MLESSKCASAVLMVQHRSSEDYCLVTVGDRLDLDNFIVAILVSPQGDCVKPKGVLGIEVRRPEVGEWISTRAFDP